MKKLNLPLIAFLLVGGLVCVVGVHLLHGYQVSRSAENLLVRAKQAEERQDVDEQVRLLRRYLRHQPDDLEAKKTLYRVVREETLADGSAGWREFFRNLSLLENTLRDHPDDEGLRREAYLSFKLVGRYADAMDHLEELDRIGALTNEDRTSWAILLWHNSEQDKALELLCELTGFDPETMEFDDEKALATDEVQAYMTLAAVYMENDTSTTKDLTIPNRIVNRAIELNPESAKAYMKRAQFIVENVKGREGREQCLDDVRKALELAPEDLDVVLFAVHRALAVSDYQWAEEILAAAKEQHAKSPKFFNRYADISHAQDNVDEAIRRINEGLEKFALNTQLLAKRAEYEIELGQIERAEETITRLAEKRNINTIYIRYLNASLMMAKEDYLPAMQTLEKLRPLVPEDGWMRRRFDQHLTMCYRALNMPDRLGQLSANRDDIQSRYSNTLAMMTQGRFEQAIDEIKELLRNEDVTKEGKVQLRKMLYQALIGQQKNLPPERRDWTQVDQLSRLIFDEEREPVQRERFEIELLVQKEMRLEALQRTEKAIRDFPAEAQFRYLLAQLTKDVEQALSILNGLEQRMGTAPELQLVRVNRLKEIQDRERFDQELQKVVSDLGQFKAEDQSRVRAAVMSAYQQAGMLSEALKVAKLRMEAGEQSISVVLNVFDMAAVAGDEEIMNLTQSQLERMASRDSAEWMLCEAHRQMILRNNGDDSVELNDISRLVDSAREKRPNFAPVYRMQAEVQLEKGNDEAAIASLRRAVELRPGELTYYQRLYQVLIENNRQSEALQVVERMPLSARPVNTDPLVEIHTLLTQDPRKAVEKAEAVFSPNSDDFDTLLQLCEIYSRAQQHAGVEEVLTRALKIDQTNSRAWLLLVRALMGQSKDDEVKVAVANAEKSIEGEGKDLAVGQLYATIGEHEKALQAYSEGLKNNPQDVTLLINIGLLQQHLKQDEAFLKTLDQIIAIDENSNPVAKSAVPQARRQKAHHLASSGVFADFHAAIELLEMNKSDRGRLVGEDLQLWLQLHASRPEASSRQTATDRLLELQRERDLTLEEKVVLAGLWHQAGEWEQAKTMVIDVMAKSPNNPQFISMYIEWLLERGDTTEASNYVKRLDQNTVRAVQYKSTILAQQEKPKEAYQSLMKNVPRMVSNLQAAAILEQLGEYDPRFFKAAKQQWDKAMELHPSQMPNYIDFLARIPNGGGLNDSLDLAEQELKKALENERLDLAQFYIGVGLKALRAGRRHINNDSPQYQRVYSWLRMGKKAGIDDQKIAWSQFDFFDIRRDTERLKKMYSEFLERTDIKDLERAVIRNNLAYLHALSDDGNEALTVIGDAISQLGPRSDFLDTRGLAYLVDGQIDNAVTDLREAAKGQPFDPGIRFHLALAEHRAGNFQQAADALKQALDMGLDPEELSLPEVKLLESLQSSLEQNGMLSST